MAGGKLSNAGRGAKGGLEASLQRLSEFLEDSTEYLDRYEAEARIGHYVIGVPLPDSREETRQRVRQILKSHGGHYIVSNARWTYTIVDS